MDKETTLNAVEKTIDVVEEQIETIERIPKLALNGTTKRQQMVILGVTAVVSALVAGGTTYILASRRLKVRYEKIAEQEIADAKKFYSVLHKKDEFADPTALADPYEDQVDNLKYKSPVDGPYETEKHLVPIVEVVPVVESVLLAKTMGPIDFDYAHELRDRGFDAPYILHYDEFMQNNPEHEQVRVTYYEGDDVLADERDQPVPDTDATVGDDNLSRFGHGSGDENVVYIRNERLKIDFEVARSGETFTDAVLGFLKHSSPRTKKHHKSRDADE